MRGVAQAFSVTLALAGPLTACDKSPVRPSAGTAGTTRVELVAPGTLAPGATVQLRLIAHKSDGSAEDITATANFSSGGDPAVLTVTRNGVATALTVGDSSVTGSDGWRPSTREVVVVPEGTFRVVGQVVEQDAPGVSVGGVRVEAEGGVVSHSTDFGGRYRLYGVPANGRIRVSKSGYVTKEIALAISDHHTENVALALAGPRADVAGAYQLTVEAAPECRGQIPDRLLVRSYPAVVTQIGTAIRVALTGATIGRGESAIPGLVEQIPGPGRVQQTRVVLQLASISHCDWEQPDSRLIEIVDDATTLDIDGFGYLLPAGASFTGPFSGSFKVFNMPQCNFSTQWLAACSSDSHRMTLSR